MRVSPMLARIEKYCCGGFRRKSAFYGAAGPDLVFDPKNGFIVSAVSCVVFGNCREGIGGTPGGVSNPEGSLRLYHSPNCARNKSNFSKIWCKVPKTPLQSFREAYRSRARGFLPSTMRARIERWQQQDLRCTSAIGAGRLAALPQPPRSWQPSQISPE